MCDYGWWAVEHWWPLTCQKKARRPCWGRKTALWGCKTALLRSCTDCPLLKLSSIAKLASKRDVWFTDSADMCELDPTICSEQSGLICLSRSRQSSRNGRWQDMRIVCTHKITDTRHSHAWSRNGSHLFEKIGTQLLCGPLMAQVRHEDLLCTGQRNIDTQTHRHTDTQTHRHTDKQTHTDTCLIILEPEHDMCVQSNSVEEHQI